MEIIGGPAATYQEKLTNLALAYQRRYHATRKDHENNNEMKDEKKDNNIDPKVAEQERKEQEQLAKRLDALRIVCEKNEKKASERKSARKGNREIPAEKVRLLGYSSLSSHSRSNCGMKVCPSCSRVNFSDMSSCEACGTKLSASSKRIIGDGNERLAFNAKIRAQVEEQIRLEELNRHVYKPAVKHKPIEQEERVGHIDAKTRTESVYPTLPMLYPVFSPPGELRTPHRDQEMHSNGQNQHGYARIQAPVIEVPTAQVVNIGYSFPNVMKVKAISSVNWVPASPVQQVDESQVPYRSLSPSAPPRYD